MSETPRKGPTTRATMFEQSALGLVGQGSVRGHAGAPDTEYVIEPEERSLISQEEIRTFLDRDWVYWSESDDSGMRKLRWTPAGRKAYDGPTA